MALSFPQRMAITAQHRSDWYTALGKTALDNLPMFEVLGRMSKEFDKVSHPLAPLIRVLLFRLKGHGVSGGGHGGRRTLGTELRGLVPDAEAMLIQAGVLSGNMAAGLFNAAKLVATQRELQASVRRALLKPAGYVSALVGLLVFFSLDLLPKFERGRPRAGWPPEAQLLGGVADHIGLIVSALVIAVVGGGALLAWLGPNWTGTRREWFDRHVFPFTMMASLNGAALLTSLAGYIGASTPIADAVANIGKSANPYMRFQCERLAASMGNGMRAEEALARLSIVHARFHWLISVYGMSGDAAQAYKTIAAEMNQRTQAFIRTLFDRVIGNVLLFAVGGALVWIYVAMFGIADSGVHTASKAPPFDHAAKAPSPSARFSSLSFHQPPRRLS